MSKFKGKRNADTAFDGGESKSQSPFMPMFESIRDELDVHHDRRERVIKASRDITAASKKIIFALQRVRETGQPIPKNLQSPQHWETIRNAYATIVSDLQGLNAYRYSNNITGGNQELMEAISFQYYLETQTLISIEEARSKLAGMSKSESGDTVMLTEADYALGVFDMVGELMRFAITSMATGARSLSADAMDADDEGVRLPERTVLSDLRELRSYLELVDAAGSSLGRDYGKKMGVMQECVEKVEKASYGQVVRGSERPKGWIPDLEDRREEVEAA